jgi:hypothetical protein
LRHDREDQVQHHGVERRIRESQAIGTILESGVCVGAIVVVLILAVVGFVVAKLRQP